jgi:anti-sigma factor RsiW
MMTNTIETWALHAYADGELQGDEKRNVEEALATSEDARQMLESIRQQKTELHKAYDQVLDEPVPAHLLKAATYSPRAGLWPRLALAASLGALAFGAASGWFAHNSITATAMAETLPQRALNAYQVYGAEQRHAVEVAASEKDHLQAWLSKRIGVKFSVPDLTAEGYALIGGRLLGEAGKPAGLLMYEDANKKRLAIYFAANSAKTNEAMMIEHQGGLVTCYWVESDMVYALAGEQSSEQMLTLAKAAHEGFDQAG